MNHDSVCNCPNCANKINITREDALNWKPKRCGYCLDVVIPYINDNDEISLIQKNEHIKGEKVAQCNCPSCNEGILFTREEALNRKPKKCSYCLDVVIPYINENDEIVVAPINKHFKEEQQAQCNCPTCNEGILFTREEALNWKPKRCSHCLNIAIPYISENNEIAVVPLNEHIIGEHYAQCNCPNCSIKLLVSREAAEKGKEIVCDHCLTKVMPYINDNNEIEIYSEDLDSHRTR